MSALPPSPAEAVQQTLRALDVATLAQAQARATHERAAAEAAANDAALAHLATPEAARIEAARARRVADHPAGTDVDALADVRPSWSGVAHPGTHLGADVHEVHAFTERRPVDRGDGVERFEETLKVVLHGGTVVPADLRHERALHGHYEAVLAHHADHAWTTHPLCAACDVREQRTPYLDADHAVGGLSDYEIGYSRRDVVMARIRSRLYRHGRMPDFLPAPRPEAVVSFLDLDGVLAQERSADLVPGLVPAAAVGYLIARDNTGKTLLALDLAMALVVGAETWHGRPLAPVTDGGVVYVMAEGAQSTGARIAAWAAHHGEHFGPEHADRFMLRPAAVNLFTGGPAFEELLDVVSERQPDLVVIDTYQRAAGGAEQNSAADTGAITARLDALKRASGGGTVLVLAHTTKADTDTRGSSAIEDDADFVLHITKAENVVTLKSTKQKDAATGERLTLRLTPVADSVVLVPTDEAPPTPARAAGAGLAPVIDEELQRRILAWLRVGETYTLTDVRDAMQRHAPGSTRAKRQEVIDRAVYALVNDGRLRDDGPPRARTVRPTYRLPETS